VRDHRIVDRIGVFGDVEILLNDAPGIGQKRPVGAYPTAIFVGLSEIVGADRDQPAITDLYLAMELQQAFGLTRSFGQKLPRLSTSTIGWPPCNSESFRCFAVWSVSS
jgi:hypothetical protein